MPDHRGVIGSGLPLAGSRKPLCHRRFGVPHAQGRIAYCRRCVEAFSRDLPEERAAALAACRELGFGVVAMEDFPASGRGATNASLAQLDKAHVYVGVFAYRYGYVEPG